MSLSRTLKTAIISVLTMVLMVSSFSPLLVDPHQAVAQITDCGVSGGATELKYDSGIPVGQMLDQPGLCNSCQAYQGVLFSLPQGVSSSVLSKVRFYAGGGKANVGIHIMNTNPAGLYGYDELLVPKAVVTVSEKKGEGNWYEVNLPDVQVPNKFWVFLEITNINVAPFYDERRTGASGEGYSWNGSRPDELVMGGGIDEYKRPHGDFLIRAYIEPEATVGKGQGYDYQTIQGAIDSLSDGWRITVHDGTYYENVTVDKSVTIKSLSGPAKTIVQTSPPYSNNDVFRITASCVTLSGFTIQSAIHAGRAGVRLEEASGCVISGNVILDNNYGIYVSETSTSNILLENECKYNVTGMYIDGSENCISGNKLHGNTAPIGSAIFLSSIASGNFIRFNTITVDPGTDPAVAAGPQLYNQSTEEVSAIENWWGTDSGPSNAGGQGPVVGDMVLFDPWLAKQPVRVKTAAARAGPFWLDSRAETSTLVVKQGSGSAFASVASFAENPVGEFKYKTPEIWFDVLLSSAKGIDEAEIRAYYTADEGNDNEVAGLKERSLRLFWWNGDKWKKCSKTGIDKDNDFVWAKLDLKSKPTPDDLAGTMFAVGVPKGEFAWWLIPLIFVLVIIALVLIRLFWVLVVQRGRYPVD